jgi:ketosteroid isomerase-like protein
MKTIKFLLLGFILISGLQLKAQDASAQLIKLMDKATVDWNKGDLDSYMALYSPKATMMLPTGRSGLQSIREMYEKYYFEGGQAKQPLNYANYEVTMLGKDNAFLTGIFILKATDKLKERKGTFTLVFIREKNGWKILHDHSG